jgi:hypothetical protein
LEAFCFLQQLLSCFLVIPEIGSFTFLPYFFNLFFFIGQLKDNLLDYQSWISGSSATLIVHRTFFTPLNLSL